MSRTVRSQFLRFALVGVAGFVVDAATLYMVMHTLGAGHYSGRAVSYLAAATSTWALNRRYTFIDRRDSNLLREWLKFLAANAAGGLVNYSVYAALVGTSGLVAAWPVLGVGAGSIAGLAVNFTLSRHLVFNKHPTAPRN
ncbi:MAG: GtrA family protein [Steroidobacteraceae bacterium]